MRLYFKWLDEAGIFHCEKCSKIEIKCNGDFICYFYDGDASWTETFNKYDLKLYKIEFEDMELGWHYD